MKLRMRVQRVGHTFANGAQPAFGSVLLTPAAPAEAPEFIPVGGTPGRRYVSAEFRIDNLEQAVAGEFADGGEYLVTVEKLPAR